MSDIKVEAFKIGDRTYRFYFEVSEERCCLRNFRVEPLSPLDAELICEILDRAFEWNYKNGVVEFWPKDAICGDKDDIALDYLLRILDVIMGFATEESLAELIIRSLSDWLTYTENGVLISKNLIEYSGVQLHIVFKLQIKSDREYIVDIEIGGMPHTVFEALKLKKELVTVFKDDIEISSMYPFFKACVVKNVRKLSDALKLFKVLIASLY
ncbi:MAG: hypothetical protein DRJ38_02205 [Thermoprotei archaeon]|nr:MAG: hypothetical protein DRJ38_02205 [Thermoprotei archaeon]